MVLSYDFWQTQFGAAADIIGRKVLIGSAAFLDASGVGAASLAGAADEMRRDGATAVLVAVDGKAAGAIAIADPVKETTPAAIEALHAEGVRIIMLTGDNRVTAEAVARRLGIDEVEAEVLPDRKSAVVERLRREGRIVAMAGDGVNDAPALAQADLGLAIGTGTDVAIESSDLTLVSGDLRAAADAVRLSRRTLATIKGNLFWAFAYNVAALPLAAIGYLNPLVAGAAMALSSVFVVSNSLRLRRFRRG